MSATVFRNAPWPVRRLKYCASYNDEVLPETTDDFEAIQYVEISDVSLVGGIENSTLMSFHEAPSRARRRARSGDILVSTVRTYLKAIAAVQEAPSNLIVSTGFCVVRPKDGLDAGYAGWIAKSEEFVGQVVSRSVGVSYPAINASQLVDIEVPLPALETQKRIAAFLDAKTAQIDGLIEKKRALLERLAEKRQVIITQAVTKGLNPAAPMKDSGIDWFGQIPAHWEIKPLKRTIFYQEGPGIMAADFREEGVPLLRVASVGGRWATLNGVNYLEPEMVARKWKHFQTREGDLLISASATSGIVSEVRREAVGCIPYTGIIRLNAIPEQSASSFIRHFAVSQPFIAQIDQLKAGSTIQHFGPYHLGLMSLAVPPVCEQTKIADYLDDILGRCEAVEAQVNGSVTRLTEYRSALITAAVTGQIEGLR